MTGGTSLRRQAARLRSGVPGLEYQQAQQTSSSPEVQAALRRNQHPIQWVPGALSPGVKRPEGGYDQSPPTTADIKKWSDTNAHLHAFVTRTLTTVPLPLPHLRNIE
jgi:hypothetical protein